MISTPFLLSAATAVFLFITTVAFGRLIPGYSHARHTISELGQYGSVYCRRVSYGVFLPVAISLAAAGALLIVTDPPVAALALSIAAGYGLGAVFPCDPGSPMSSSTRQALHNLGGAIEYLGGALSLFIIAESLGLAFRVAGFAVAIAVVVLSFESPVRGIAQRVAETCLFVGLLAAIALQ